MTWAQRYAAPALLVAALVLAVGAVVTPCNPVPLTAGAAVCGLLTLVAADTPPTRGPRL